MLESILGFHHALVGQQNMALDDLHVIMVAVQPFRLLYIVDGCFRHLHLAIGETQFLIDFHQIGRVFRGLFAGFLEYIDSLLVTFHVDEAAALV